MDSGPSQTLISNIYLYPPVEMKCPALVTLSCSPRFALHSSRLGRECVQAGLFDM